MKHLDAYADLVLAKGINVKPQEDLLINAPIDAAPFVEALVKLAYERFNSGTVHVNWNDATISRHKLKHASDQVLGDVPNYILARYDTMLKRGAAVLNISSSLPGAMRDIDPKRLRKASELTAPKVRPFDQKMYNELKWCVVPYPNKAWAKRVYPKLEEDAAYDKLVDAFIYMMHLDEKHPREAWDAAIENLERRRKLLNERNYKALRIRSRETQLEIALPEDHRFVGVLHDHKNGAFLRQMPDYRLYTSPHKYGVEGTLRMTAPLNVRGQFLKPFTVNFEEGRIKQIMTDQKDAIDRLFKVDEGASYLGKIALVGDDSPVANLKTYFSMQMLDANIGCHVAFGQADPKTLHGGNKLNREGLEEAGLNHSRIHVDAIFQSPDLKVYGIDGEGVEELIIDRGAYTGNYT